MSLIPWRRTESLIPRMFEIDDVWNRMWGDGGERFPSHLPEVFRAHSFPPVNVAEEEGSYCITLDCPGLEENDFEISAMGNTLLISGERKWEDEKKGKEFRRVESQYGKFERTVPLPENAHTEPDQIDASYKKGVLTITVPKLEKTPAAKIPVHPG